MFTIYTSAHYDDGGHENCPSEVFETLADARDSLPQGSEHLTRMEYLYYAQPGDGDGERTLISYTFTIYED